MRVFVYPLANYKRPATLPYRTHTRKHTSARWNRRRLPAGVVSNGSRRTLPEDALVECTREVGRTG